MNDGTRRWEFWIDVGGTFTDCLARRPDGVILSHKLLSTSIYKGTVEAGSSADAIMDSRRREDPQGFFNGFGVTLSGAERAGEARRADYDGVTVRAFDAATGRLELERPLAATPETGTTYELASPEEAPLAGIRWLFGKRLGDDLGDIDVRLSTTRGTNALLEDKGAAVTLITTASFADMLAIGYQARPRLFDLHIRKPAPLYRNVIELSERIDAKGNVLRPLDPAEVRRKLDIARTARAESIAICLMNSYRNPAHELLVEKIAREMGFVHVSVSSSLSPLQGIVSRGETSVVDACLTPVIRSYVDTIRAGIPNGSLGMMTSAGGLTAASSFVAKDSVLSGPAGGVVGCAEVARRAGFDRAIGFDMGGTSTDVSRYDGEFERRHEMQIEDRRTGGHILIAGDMLAIETVAAGGGSVCGFDGVKPIVGPDSAGAEPGPACYGRGGPLCLTDVNFLLGRIPPDGLPFPLDAGAARARVDETIERIAAATGRRYDRESLAAGYVEIANHHMAAAIKRISIQRGYDPRDYVLVAFGGAGGQHACAVARELGIRNVLLHPLAGVLSAFGVGMADVRRSASREVGKRLTEAAIAGLEETFVEMEAGLRRAMHEDGMDDARLDPPRRFLDLRYEGQDARITVARPTDDQWRRAFEYMHRRLYGFAYRDRAVEVFAARAELIARSPKPTLQLEPSPVAGTGFHAAQVADVYFEARWTPTPIHRRESLPAGTRLDGPAVILESTGTIVVEPDWSGRVTERGDILLTQSTDSGGSSENGRLLRQATDDACDPVELELFNSHFAAVSEHMGATLQKTALSTNVKERLDFSCAVLDADAGLVAHAPHIPVHLGAMGECVRRLVQDIRDDPAADPIRPGDVFVTNDPFRGGSHLPDVTVITPVFDVHGGALLFFTASRAHHAEIGGIAPGSMAPRSRSLAEEGVVIRAMRLVVADAEPGDTGDIQIRDDELRQRLSSGPHPSRDVEQNMADIHAQIAANQCGVAMLRDMVDRYGASTVQRYMRGIQEAADTKMRSALREMDDGEYRSVDCLDDGTPIAVAITINGGEASVDFTGTGAVHAGNLNATPAIVASAVLYCFRSLIDEDIPLNAGVLAPIRITIPENSLLNPQSDEDPSRCPAVAGGNVETSQRIVDVIFGALGVAAASQGTMNNFIFGNDRFGYYETIGGGAGAGPQFDGADAVHTHMTNTRLTDPEVLEDRYPVRLRRFSIRRGSGGGGKHRGGDGIVREVEFLAPLEVSLVTQRRSRAPYGLHGGGAGQPGRNVLLSSSIVDDNVRTEISPRESMSARTVGTEVLPSICELRVSKDDVIIIETPGGGGCDGH